MVILILYKRLLWLFLRVVAGYTGKTASSCRREGTAKLLRLECTHKIYFTKGDKINFWKYGWSGTQEIWPRGWAKNPSNMNTNTKTKKILFNSYFYNFSFLSICAMPSRAFLCVWSREVLLFRDHWCSKQLPTSGCLWPPWTLWWSGSGVPSLWGGQKRKMQIKDCGYLECRDLSLYDKW